MNDSGTSGAPGNLARANTATSSNRFEGIPIWNWRPALISNSVDDFRRPSRQSVRTDHDYDASISFQPQVEIRRPIIQGVHDYLTVAESDYSLEPLPSATMMVNLLENRHLAMLYPRVIIVDHDRGYQRVANNRNVFIDFFGGGDSPETIIEYYRRRILNVITAGRHLLSTGVRYVRAE